MTWVVGIGHTTQQHRYGATQQIKAQGVLANKTQKTGFNYIF